MKQGRYNNQKRQNFRTGNSPHPRDENNVISLFNLNDAQSNASMNERFIFMLAKSKGCKAIATVNSGAQYQGIVLAVEPQELSVVLGNVESVGNILGGEKDDTELSNSMIIGFKDLMDLELKDVDVAAAPYVPNAAPSSGVGSEKSGFRTDTDISGNVKIRERDLQKWTADEDDGENVLLSGSLEDSNGKNHVWDQFAVNEKKFGVQSTWDESLYTTKLNKDAPDYQEKLREADRIAREIESQGYDGNIHLAEERGIKVDDSGFDEEDKYSGVARDTNDKRGNELMAALRSGISSGDTASSVAPVPLPSASNGKYIPPKQRNEVHNLDPAIISSAKKSVKSAKQLSESPQSSVSSLSSLKKSDSRHDITQHTHHHHHSHLHQTHQESRLAVSNQKHRNEDSRLSTQQEINSLKEFSQNFKIPQKFPPDLLPILAKDKSKQDEIIKKVNGEKVAGKIKPAEKSQSPSPVVTRKPELPSKPDITPKPSPKPAHIRKKMDPNAPEFVLNPDAPVFTPSKAFQNNSPRVAKRSVTNQTFSVKPAKNGKNLNGKSFNFILNSGENIEKAFQTQPTWGSTLSEDHRSLYTSEVPMSPMGVGLGMAPMGMVGGPQMAGANMSVNMNMMMAVPRNGYYPPMMGGMMGSYPGMQVPMMMPGGDPAMYSQMGGSYPYGFSPQMMQRGPVDPMPMSGYSPRFGEANYGNGPRGGNNGGGNNGPRHGNSNHNNRNPANYGNH